MRVRLKKGAFRKGAWEGMQCMLSATRVWRFKAEAVRCTVW